MTVKFKEDYKYSLNGIDVKQFLKGEMIDIPKEQAELLLKAGKVTHEHVSISPGVKENDLKKENDKLREDFDSLQKDFDAVKEENETRKGIVDNVTKDFDSLQKDFDALTKEKSKSNSENKNPKK